MKNSKRWRLILPILLVGWFLWSRQEQQHTADTNRTGNLHIAKQTLIKQPVNSLQASPRKSASIESKGLTAEKLVTTTLTVEEIKSIRSSIKLNMSALYTAQASFNSDVQRYTTDIAYAGFSLEKPSYFKMGFLSPFHPHETYQKEQPEDSLNSDALVLKDSYREQDGEIPYHPTASEIDLDQLSKYCTKGCTAAEDGFEAIFAANLDSDDTLDVWLINEKKQIIHKVDDLKE
mgnify:CR=1 FL=1